MRGIPFHSEKEKKRIRRSQAFRKNLSQHESSWKKCFEPPFELTIKNERFTLAAASPN